MDTTPDILLDRWLEIRGQVRKRWSKLTDDDLARLSGKTDELVVVLQQRYGYGKVQAKIEIENWLYDQDQHAKP